MKTRFNTNSGETSNNEPARGECWPILRYTRFARTQDERPAYRTMRAIKQLNFRKWYKQFASTYKIPILCLTLFVSVFGLLGLPFTRWNYFLDDYGQVYHVSQCSWRDIPQFFSNGDAEQYQYPSNKKRQQAFFCGIYRPFVHVTMLLQYKLWGNSPYLFFLANIALHALCTMLLFLFFLLFCSTFMAFTGALCFGFHPSLWCWLGWICTQQYHLELLCLLTIFTLMYQFWRTKTIAYYIVACLVYAFVIFLKEQSIIFPLWLMLTYGLFFHPDQKQSLFKKIAASLKVSAGFWGVSVFYLGTRAYFFPITSNSETLGFQLNIYSFLHRQTERFYDAVSYASDTLGLCWLPSPHPWIKGSLIVVLTAIIIWLFRRVVKSQNPSNKKLSIFLLFLLGSFLLWGWPSLIRFHHPRYLYTALPFFILFILLLLQHQRPFTMINNIKIQRFSQLVFLALVVCNGLFVAHRLKQQELVTHDIAIKFKNLIAQPQVINQPVCLVGLPHAWFRSSSAQALWLLGKDPKTPVYQFSSVADIEPHYATPNTVFITWDYEGNNFLVVPQYRKISKGEL